MDLEYERLNELFQAHHEAVYSQKHLSAQVSVLETVCLTLCSQSPANEIVLAKIRDLLTTCGNANLSKPHPDWPLQEHYLRRFMLLVEDRVGSP
ncbi:MAG TPA: hypothetical protein VHB46_09835 [Burkholderiales bacterium]|nr:hypothetical protein [Burkholderiales bacterium]